MIKLDPVSVDEAARYMGVRGVPDAATAELIKQCELVVREKVRPAYVYREVSVVPEESGVFLPEVELRLPGNDIIRHLDGCSRAVIMAATVSAEADKLIRQAAVTNMAESLAYDCLCSAAVEQVCEKAEKEIFSGDTVRYRTWRFSPGYGDLPISVQGDFLRALNAQRRIGLTVTDSCLLLPSKSVTAIIGISEEPPAHQSGSGCDICNMRDRCAFSRTGGCGRG